MTQSSVSGGIPGWLVAVGGVALGLAIVIGYVLTNLPPDAAEKARASYERGYEAGSRDNRVRGAEVRRTPLTANVSG